MKPQIKRVLIVDDNPGILKVLSEYLLRRGFEIGIAKSAEEALRLFAYDNYDLVITDFKMPNMDGKTLASKIKSARPQTIIIMISGDQNIGSQMTGVVDHFIPKPFHLEQMDGLVNWVLG